MQKVLNNTNANIFVSDYDTLKAIFADKPFREEAGKVPRNTECWGMLNVGLEDGCKYYPRPKLLDTNRKFTGVHFWEGYNPVTKRQYTIQSTTIKWLDGCWAIIESTTDVTTRKQVELELIQAEERAEESDRLKSASLVNMSHEIHTPSNVIVGFSSLLVETDETELRHAYMSLVQENNELLLNLISDILDISRVEAGMINLVMGRADVPQLCRGVVATFSRKERDTAVELRLDEDSPQIMIDADKDRIMQVLSSSLTSALKFVTEGSIILSYSLEDEGQVCFCVTDTGEGILDEQKHEIFNRFTKLDSFVQGAELGLSVCQSLVNRMDEKIGVKSRRRERLYFWFTHPYVPGAQPEKRDCILKQTTYIVPQNARRIKNNSFLERGVCS